MPRVHRKEDACHHVRREIGLIYTYSGITIALIMPWHQMLWYLQSPVYKRNVCSGAFDRLSPLCIISSFVQLPWLLQT